MGKMKVALMESKRKMVWVEREIPAPKSGEVLVKIKHVGICGSDLHFYQDGQLGNWIPDGPLVLGHESAGVVIGLGEGVTSFQIGDKVAMEPGVPCGQCEWCKKGLYNLCDNISFMAIPKERDGVFLEYCAHPANMCYKLPENVSTMAGALCEPLSVGLHAVNMSEAKLGQNAVVFGSGCIGLITMMVLQNAGISDITVIDVIQKRLDKALELGASKVIRADKENVLEAVGEMTGGKGVDLVFEAAGNSVSTLQTAKIVKKAGTVTLIGMASKPELTYDIGSLMDKEATLKTVFRYRNLYPTAINVLKAGNLPIEAIVTHKYAFAQTPEAVEYNTDNKQDVIKGVIYFDD